MHEFAVNRKGDVLLLSETDLPKEPTRARLNGGVLAIYAGEDLVHQARGIPDELMRNVGSRPSLYVVECPGNRINRETKVPLAT